MGMSPNRSNVNDRLPLDQQRSNLGIRENGSRSNRPLASVDYRKSRYCTEHKVTYALRCEKCFVVEAAQREHERRVESFRMATFVVMDRSNVQERVNGLSDHDLVYVFWRKVTRVSAGHYWTDARIKSKHEEEIAK